MGHVLISAKVVVYVAHRVPEIHPEALTHQNEQSPGTHDLGSGAMGLEAVERGEGGIGYLCGVSRAAFNLETHSVNSSSEGAVPKFPAMASE